MSNQGVNKGRRQFLTAATSVVGAAGAVAVVVPFVASWNPSAKARAAGAPVKADISKLEPGQILGTVESVKAVSEIYCPVDGEIIERNTALIDHPEELNQDPHGKAWMVKLKLAPGADTSGLMDASAYEAFAATSQH